MFLHSCVKLEEFLGAQIVVVAELRAYKYKDGAGAQGLRMNLPHPSTSF